MFARERPMPSATNDHRLMTIAHPRLRVVAFLSSAVALLGPADRAIAAHAPSAEPAALVRQAPLRVAPVTAPSEVTVTATRIAKPIVVDGALDDDAYRSVGMISGFIQQEPREGDPASEPTDVWVMFDDKNLYISARCWDSQPGRQIANELRRDLGSIFQNENFTVTLDTFHDLRNGFFFQTNPLGAVRDQAIVDEAMNESWNTIWEVRTNRSDKGYTIEIAIPFKSLRYRGSGPQVWGINFRRVVRWKNEFSYLTPMPAAFGTGNAVNRMGSAATLIGLETPRQSMNLELKPYVATSLTTDRSAAVSFTNQGSASAGFDFKYGLTRGLVADATINTDFAQVEEDQQQVNLTRFSLFFPEKREFFLEGQGVFAFGGVTFGNSSGSASDVPVMFFSRQIGLSQGQSVPVLAGGRLTGRTGRYSLGALNIQTNDKPEAGAVATNFTALRVKRDVLRRSNIGLIATRRDAPTSGRDASLTFGADANLFLFKNVTANAYFAQTDSPGKSSGQASYRGRVEYAGDRYGLVAEHLLVGEQFTPEVGYVRRTDLRRSFGQLRFSPRPKNSRYVRKYGFTGSLDYITDANASSVQERGVRGLFNVEFQNGDQWNVDFTRDYELLPRAFAINAGTTVPAGGYDYQNLRTQYTLGVQRKVAGRIAAAYGTLYNGTKAEAGYTGRIGFVPRFAVEPSISLNWIRLPYGDFSAPVISSRIILTLNPRAALSSFLQYNGGTRTMSSSARLRWEYRGGSELFVVYSDGRTTVASGYPELLNRSVAIKVTRLLRF